MVGVNPGELDRRIAILANEPVDNGTATVDGEYAEIGRRWAKKTDASDGERMRASQVGQHLTSRFLVHSDSLTRTIGGKHRIMCDGQLFDVTGAKEWGGRHVGIEITAAAIPS